MPAARRVADLEEELTFILTLMLVLKLILILMLIHTLILMLIHIHMLVRAPAARRASQNWRKDCFLQRPLVAGPRMSELRSATERRGSAARSSASMGGRDVEVEVWKEYEDGHPYT